MFDSSTHTMFFIAFTLYFCITIGIVIFLIMFFKKKDRPDLPKAVQGVDYFTVNEPPPLPTISSIEYFFEKMKDNKQVLTFLESSKQYFYMKYNKGCTDTSCLKLALTSNNLNDLAKMKPMPKFQVYAAAQCMKDTLKVFIQLFNIDGMFSYVSNLANADIIVGFDNMKTISSQVKGDYISYNAPIEKVKQLLPFGKYENVDYLSSQMLVIDFLIMDEKNATSKTAKDYYDNLNDNEISSIQKLLRENVNINNFYEQFFSFSFSYKFIPSIKTPRPKYPPGDWEKSVYNKSNCQLDFDNMLQVVSMDCTNGNKKSKINVTSCSTKVNAKDDGTLYCEEIAKPIETPVIVPITPVIAPKVFWPNGNYNSSFQYNERCTVTRDQSIDNNILMCTSKNKEKKSQLAVDKCYSNEVNANQNGTLYCDKLIETFDQPISSTISFVMEKDINKHVITFISNKKKYFVMRFTNKKLRNNTLENLIFVSNGTPLRICVREQMDVKHIVETFVSIYNIQNVEFVKDETNADILADISDIPVSQDILTYNNVPVDRLNFFYPFARFFMDKYTGYQYFIVDFLIYRTKDKSKLTDEMVSLIKENEDINTFYELYFPFRLPNNNDLIIENYKASELDIIIDRPIPEIKFLINKYDDLKVLTFPIQFYAGMIAIGDKLHVSKQEDNSMTGAYYVTKVTKDDVIISTYNTFLNFYNNFEVVRKTDEQLVGRVQAKNGGLPNNIKIWFTDLDLPGTLSNQLVVVYQNPTHEDKYHCIPDNTYKTQESCESPNDFLGNKKKEFMVWDRPCMVNTDCPFYKINKRRGGCKDGFCEMPVGVKRIAYTRYLDGPNSYPYCHGCIQMNSNCCNESPNPEYAFKFDYMERNGKHF